MLHKKSEVKLDPACGSANFLLHAQKRFEKITNNDKTCKIPIN